MLVARKPHGCQREAWTSRLVARRSYGTQGAACTSVRCRSLSDVHRRAPAHVRSEWSTHGGLAQESILILLVLTSNQRRKQRNCDASLLGNADAPSIPVADPVWSQRILCFPLNQVGARVMAPVASRIAVAIRGATIWEQVPQAGCIVEQWP